VDTILDEIERRELRRKARMATLAALRALGEQARREAIKEQAVAAGEFTPRELAATAPDRPGAKPVRVLDQQMSWALSDLKRDGLVENPERGIWVLTAAAKRLDELQRMPYAEYLETPEWQGTRSAALQRAAGSCALDLTHTTDLDVRHRTKARIGAELPTDLVVLCAPCAERHQAEDEPPPRRVGSIPPPTLVAPVEAELSEAAEDESRRPRLLRRLLAS
jgi:5-methylcytosine-specific restriction endonuclease McrA